MGYTTTFDGILKFKNELKSSELAYLKTLFDEDCRDHPEWNARDLYYIQWELSDDFSGIQWDGSEKFYGSVETVNLIIRLMNEKFDNGFGFIGELICQGESYDDRWKLSCDGTNAKRIDIVLSGKKVECPHCGEEFIAEESE
jgi:hypothetical protein